MAPSRLILKRASASRPSGEWNDDDYDRPLADVRLRGHTRGRDGGVREELAAQVNASAMAAFRKSWQGN
jgi:hypothetical protein